MSLTNDDANKRPFRLKEIPVRVDRVIINGVQRTKNHVVINSVKGILKATNFQEMLKYSQEAKIHMEKLGIFKDIEIIVDTSKGANQSAESYEVQFAVEEFRRVSGGINTLVGTNDASLLFSLRAPNVTGRGERLNLEYTHGTRHTRGANLMFSKPIDTNPDIIFTCGGSQSYGEFPWSAYKETDRNTMADFTFPSLLGVHSVRWEGVWRDLRALSAAPFAIRESAGHSVKSALTHILSRDSRNDQILPSAGSMIRLSQEYAGIGGDVQFEKHQLQMQFNKSLILGTVLQLTAEAGLLTSHSGERQRVNDLFMLGGPLTLRGFNIKGVGPNSEGCALGGDTYWQCGAHLYTPLPFSPGKGGFGDLFRSHFFVTAGNLINRTDESDAPISWRNGWQLMTNSVRLSYGAGIVLRMGRIARLELNYVFPVLVHKGDSVCHGVQFGVGVWYS